MINRISDIKKIDKVLKKYWREEASKEKPKKPSYKIVFIYLEEKKVINGFLYAYDINDGYFHWCILDDLHIKKKSDDKSIKKLVKELIGYCKKEKIESIDYDVSERDIADKNELHKIFRGLGFKIEKEHRESASYIIE